MSQGRIKCPTADSRQLQAKDVIVPVVLWVRNKSFISNGRMQLVEIRDVLHWHRFTNDSDVSMVVALILDIKQNYNF